MFGGSIYIDPDSVSNVSSQIGITAEQLDSLRQTIVPQVNEVICMSYPSIHEMPNVAYPLDSTQGNIEAFNYRAQLLAEDLRTTSPKLTQIAEAGRTMNEILLRQTTMFGSMSTGGETVSHSPLQVPDPWGSLIGDLGVAVGPVTELIKILSKAGVLSKIDVLLKNKDFENLAHTLDTNSNAKFCLFVFGFLTDVLSGKPITWSNVAAELTGNAIGAIATDNDVGAAIVATFGAIQLSSTVMSWEQGWLANQYGKKSAIGSALQDTANNFTTIANDADTSKFFDDLGPLASDTIGAGVGGIAGLFGYHLPTPGWGSAYSDATKTFDDFSNTVYSAPEFLVNVDAMQLQDTSLGTNWIVQHSFLPQSWKTSYQQSTVKEIQAIAKVSDEFTNNVSN